MGVVSRFIEATRPLFVWCSSSAYTLLSLLCLSYRVRGLRVYVCTLHSQKRQLLCFAVKRQRSEEKEGERHTNCVFCLFVCCYYLAVSVFVLVVVVLFVLYLDGFGICCILTKCVCPWYIDRGWLGAKNKWSIYPLFVDKLSCVVCYPRFSLFSSLTTKNRVYHYSSIRSFSLFCSHCFCDYFLFPSLFSKIK